MYSIIPYDASQDHEFDAMADACIEAGELVTKGGSPELQAAMRVTLRILGRDIIKQRRLDILDIADVRRRLTIVDEDAS